MFGITKPVGFDANGVPESGQWQLQATTDACGTVLRRTSRPEDADSGAAGAFTLDSKGRVTFREHRGVFTELAGASSWASNTHTLVVAVPRSHHLFILAFAPV